MKNKWIALTSMYLAIGAVNAASMVCSPNNFGPQGYSQGYGNQGYGNQGYPMQGGYAAPNSYMGNGGYGAPQGYNSYPQSTPYAYGAAPQQMPYNGMTPPPGMMIQQPGMAMPYAANGMMPQQSMVQQQAPAAIGGRCTCQKTGSAASLQAQAGTLQAQGAMVINDNGVLKVYDPNAVANAAVKKPGVKVVYDDSHPNDDIVLIRPTTMSQDQKSALESQVTGLPAASSSASFNSAMASMTKF